MPGMPFMTLVFVLQLAASEGFELLDEKYLLTFERRADVAIRTPTEWTVMYVVVPGLECFPFFEKGLPQLKDFPTELTHQLRSTDKKRRAAAVTYLGRLAMVTRAAAWQRERDEGDDVFRIALGKYEEPVHVALDGILKDTKGEEALFAATAMLALDMKYPQALDIVAKEISAEEPERRKAASEIVGRARLSNPKVIQALSKAIGDQDKEVRLAAAEAAWRLGPKAGKTVPALIELLKSGDAAYGDVVPYTLCIALPERRNVALLALGQIGADAKPAVSVLVGMLSSKEEDTRVSVLVCLAEIGPAAREAMPELSRKLSVETGKARFHAAAALLCIDSTHEEAAAILSAGLKSENGKTRSEAVVACGIIAPMIKSLIPGLLAALKDSEGSVREHALSALTKMGPLAEPAIPVLVQMLKTDDFQAAATALGSIGKASLPALAKVIQKRKPSYAQWLATYALGLLGKDGEEAVPILIKALSHKDDLVRWSAAAALGRLKRVAAPAREALTRASREDPKAGELAAWALTQLDR
jgi:HEAT repeat protein